MVKARAMVGSGSRGCQAAWQSGSALTPPGIFTDGEEFLLGLGTEQAVLSII
jgi:hypothetical protein